MWEQGKRTANAGTYRTIHIHRKEAVPKSKPGETVVAYAGKIKFLGYGFYKNQKGYQPRVHGKSHGILETLEKGEDKIS